MRGPIRHSLEFDTHWSGCELLPPEAREFFQSQSVGAQVLVRNRHLSPRSKPRHRANKLLRLRLPRQCMSRKDREVVSRLLRTMLPSAFGLRASKSRHLLVLARELTWDIYRCLLGRIMAELIGPPPINIDFRNDAIGVSASNGWLCGHSSCGLAFYHKPPVILGRGACKRLPKVPHLAD